MWTIHIIARVERFCRLFIFSDARMRTLLVVKSPWGMKTLWHKAILRNLKHAVRGSNQGLAVTLPKSATVRWEWELHCLQMLAFISNLIGMWQQGNLLDVLGWIIIQVGLMVSFCYFNELGFLADNSILFRIVRLILSSFSKDLRFFSCIWEEIMGSFNWFCQHFQHQLS